MPKGQKLKIFWKAKKFRKESPLTLYDLQQLGTFMLKVDHEDSLTWVVLWNRNGLLRFRCRLWKSFGSGSGFRQYLAVFQQSKNCTKNYNFPMLEAFDDILRLS